LAKEQWTFAIGESASWQVLLAKFRNPHFSIEKKNTDPPHTVLLSLCISKLEMGKVIPVQGPKVFF
jgi:hypothetical protein